MMLEGRSVMCLPRQWASWNQAQIKTMSSASHFFKKTGSGSKSLCKPTVKDSYEWTGQRVASLSKCGSFIYLLANERLPGWIKKVVCVCVCVYISVLLYSCNSVYCSIDKE